MEKRERSEERAQRAELLPSPRQGMDPLVELLRCQQYPSYFIATYCQIRHPVQGAIPFALWPWQAQLLGDFQREPQLVILKSRQLGCSELVCAYALWLARFHEAQTILMLSRRQEDASDLLDRIGYMWDHLPVFLQMAIGKRSATLLEFKHPSPSKIQSLPATKGTGRGKPASLVISDEWAHQPWQSEIWTAIKPTIATGGQFIGLSTANGLGDVFHQTCMGAQSGENGFAFLFLPWSMHPDRDDAWYHAQSLDMEPWQLHQEYPTTPGEAFIQSGRPVFSAQYLDLHEQRILGDPLCKAIRGPTDGLSIWQPLIAGHRYLIGADVAEGLADGDFDAACVLDLTTMQQVAALRGKWPPEIFARKLAQLGELFGFPLLAVERNNHGHACILKLKDLAYPNLYHHTLPLHEEHPTRQPVAGWPTTRVTKPLMLDSLAAGLRELVYLPRDLIFLAEARVFSYTDNGGMEAPPGFHDDTVMAHAIAVHLAMLPDVTLQTVQLFKDLAAKRQPKPEGGNDATQA